MALLTLFWFCFLCVYFATIFASQKTVTNYLNVIFQENIFVTSVIKFILKCENYACIRTIIIFIFSLLSRKGKLQPQINIFHGNKSPFSIKSTVALVKIFETGNQSFRFEILLPQAARKKETYCATKKILQNFEGHDDWHCQDIAIWVIYHLNGQNLLRVRKYFLIYNYTYQKQLFWQNRQELLVNIIFRVFWQWFYLF